MTKEETKSLRRSEPAASNVEDLRARTLELLDFPTVRRLVAEHARFPAARELALRMEPTYEHQDVARLQALTSEGVAFLKEAADVDLHDSGEASAAVERAALGGTLTGLELLLVAALVKVQGQARSAFLRRRQVAPTLADIAEGIPELGEFHRQTHAAIGIRGDVLDDATPALRSIRRQVRRAYQSVTDALERVLQSSSGREALQDQVISIRGERLVVQVKTEMRHRVPGVVHDASNTGATLFVEPFATVDLCNAWRELVLEEERETEMVLSELSGLVAEAAGDIERGTALTAELDFILARARYGMSSSEVTRIDQGGVAGGLPADRPMNTHLADARHPLVEKEAVPITVNIGPGWTVLVITGPNTGGKTVAMKTVGLLALMHQAGLRVPAEEGSSLPVFDGIYADVGDQQSIQQSVSTFGSHMRNVIGILGNATSESLVLLDELGTSTDPEEGSALAKAILAHLASRKVATIATTHHRTVAAYAEAAPGMMNASVELDASTLKPTYHLTYGIPGRSYAMSVATQMGLAEEIMQEAESLLEPQYMRFEEWLSELQQSRDQLKLRLEEAEQAERAAASVSRELEAELADIASRKDDILVELREEVTREYEQARKRLRRAESVLSWTAAGADVSEAKTEIAAATDELKALDRRASQSAPQRGDRPLAVGDTVNVRGLNVQGTVVSLPDKGGEAEVAIGEVRFSLDVHRLSQAEETEARESHDSAIRYDLGPVLATAELDLRGWRVEDAKIGIEEFLDKAVRDGLSSVRIIHGKGTGALRQAARELLEGHPLAKSFAPEAPGQGGDGATVVELT